MFLLTFLACILTFFFGSMAGRATRRNDTVGFAIYAICGVATVFLLAWYLFVPAK